jgi:Nucleoside transporter
MNLDDSDVVAAVASSSNSEDALVMITATSIHVNDDVGPDNGRAEEDGLMRDEPDEIHRQHPLSVSDRLLLPSVFMFLGVGVLVPWNAFISAVDYFNRRLCENGIVPDVEAWFGAVFNASSVVAVGIIILLQTVSSQRNVASTDPTDSDTFWMVIPSLTISLFVFVSTSSLVTISSLPTSLFRYLTLWSVAACGMATAATSAGLVTTAAVFSPTMAIHPFMTGQSLGGVMVALVNFLAATLKDPSIYNDSYCVSRNSTEILAPMLMRSWLGIQSAQRSLKVPAETRHLAQDEYNDIALEGTLYDLHGSCAPYDEPDWVVFSYFSLGAIVLLGCLVSFFYTRRLSREIKNGRVDHEFDDSRSGRVQNLHSREALESGRVAYESIEPTSETPEGSGEELRFTPCHRASSDISVRGLELATSPSHPFSPVNQDDLTTRVVGPESPRRPQSDSLVRRLVHSSHIYESQQMDEEITPSSLAHTLSAPAAIRLVWVRVRRAVATIFLTFLVTLALFPGLTTQLRSIHQCQPGSHRLSNDLYTPLTFVVFNVGDFAGRLVAARLPVDGSRSWSAWLVSCALARFLFFPLLLWCTAESNGVMRGLVHSDFYSIVVQSLFAVSNGLLVSTAFAFAPTQLPPEVPMAQERSSEFLTLSVSLGLLCGSLLSFPVLQLASRVT